MILQFPEKKKPKAKDGVYTCVRCNGVHFMLKETGAVECSNCGASIHNLFVVGKPE